VSNHLAIQSTLAPGITRPRTPLYLIERDLPVVYSFGPFRLEVGERRLLREGQVVPLAGKAFDTLRLLVEGAGTLQRQDRLMDQLWPDVSVEQNNLQYNICRVRRALAGAPGVVIETVRGHGYRLLAEVRVIS
jgi:DNA-binding winged helix-turn-helix (wHTH) protein